MPGLFEDAGFDVSGGGTKSAADAASAGTLFRDAGFSVPTAATKATAAADTLSQMKAKAAAEGVNLPTPGEAPTEQPTKSTPSKVVEAIDSLNPVTLAAKGVERAIYDTIEHAAAGWQQLKQGITEIRRGEGAPHYVGPGKPGHVTNLLGETREVPGLPEYAPGGYLRAAGGGAGILTSPVTGTTNALVTRPVTELTGNPEIGDRAAFVANALLPVKAGGKAVEATAPSTKGMNQLVEMVGPENVPEAVARLRQNPRLSVADVSDPVRVATQGLIDPAQPAVQNLVTQAVKDRAATRTEAANTAFTHAMGPAPDVPAMVEGLKDRARKAGSEAIQPALEGAKAVDISPVIAAIDKEVKPGIEGLKSGLPLSPRQQELWRLRNQLVDPETGEQLFDPKRLHEIQSRTGDLAYNFQRSGDGWSRTVGNGLRDVNEKLVDAIDTAAGGAYRPGRAKFKDAKDISEAFESGFDTLQNRRGLTGAMEDSPAAFKKWMNEATPEEVVARRLGTRADIDARVNGVKNGALAGQTITAIPYNQAKLRMLFGDKEANRLIGVMKDAEDEAHTNYQLLKGSKTAETLAGRNALEVPKVEPFQLGSLTQMMLPSALADIAGQYVGTPMGITGLGLLGTGIAAGTLKKGTQITAKKMAEARNYEFARNALAAGPAREETINSLLSHPKVVRELKKRANVLTVSGASP